MNEAPFPLAYLDWCKKEKNVKSVEETERRDWVSEFYMSDEWGRKDITFVDLAIATGYNLDRRPKDGNKK